MTNAEELVLGVWTGSRWKGTLVNSIHNGGNALERDRVVSEHPGENECMVTDRILGWLAPTRGASSCASAASEMSLD